MKLLSNSLKKFFGRLPSEPPVPEIHSIFRRLELEEKLKLLRKIKIKELHLHLCDSDLNEPHDHGLKLLHLALMADCSLKVILELINMGAKPFEHGPDPSVGPPILFAIGLDKNLKFVMTIAKTIAGEKNINCAKTWDLRDKEGNNPLSLASLNSDIRLLKFFLKIGLEPDGHHFFQVIEYGSVEALKCMYSSGFSLSSLQPSMYTMCSETELLRYITKRFRQNLKEPMPFFNSFIFSIDDISGETQLEREISAYIQMSDRPQIIAPNSQFYRTDEWYYDEGLGKLKLIYQKEKMIILNDHSHLFTKKLTQKKEREFFLNFLSRDIVDQYFNRKKFLKSFNNKYSVGASGFLPTFLKIYPKAKTTTERKFNSFQKLVKNMDELENKIKAQKTERETPLETFFSKKISWEDEDKKNLKTKAELEKKLREEIKKILGIRSYLYTY